MKKTKHSILSNLLFSHRLLLKELGPRYLLNDALALAFGVLGPFATIAFPGFVIAEISTPHPMHYKAGLILLYALGLKIMVTLQNYVNNEQIMAYFMGRIVASKPIREHMVHMDFEAMESKTGQEKQRAAVECFYTGNDYGIEAFMLQFPQFLMNAIGFVIYSALVLRISLPLFLFMLITATFFSLLNLKQNTYWDKTKGLKRDLFIRRNKAFKECADTQARGDILLYHMKTWLIDRLHKICDDYGRYFGAYYKLETRTQLAMHCINMLRDALVYYVLISKIMAGLLTVPELLLMIGVISGYNGWMQQMLSCVQKIAVNAHTVGDYRNYLEYGRLVTPNPCAALEARKSHEIRLENLSYRYEGATEDVLTDVNLTIKVGEKLALVGGNGAGKTTLVKLITGLYQPSGGSIYIDGIDASSLDRTDYYNAFSVVFQDMMIYAASVAENVSCSLKPNRHRVQMALEAAGLWEKIESYPKGMDTPMTQILVADGITLSGGQTQKLMLARALYQDAPVLILDEPTAALDPIAESEMYETYNSFAKEKTSVFISHRLSSTRFCDRVCFLKDGRITEVGTHDELMVKGGDYSEMYAIQSKYYVESTEEVL